jgi:Coenzyme PQQ synthesis protein D (PqqD)
MNERMDEPMAEPIETGFVLVRADAVYTVTIDDEAVLLDEANDRLHHLNRTAALLWRCFDGDASIAQLAFEASDELGLPYDTVLTDTLAIVRHLADEHLVRDGRP